MALPRALRLLSDGMLILECKVWVLFGTCRQFNSSPSKPTCAGLIAWETQQAHAHEKMGGQHSKNGPITSIQSELESPNPSLTVCTGCIVPLKYHPLSPKLSLPTSNTVKHQEPLYCPSSPPKLDAATSVRIRDSWSQLCFTAHSLPNTLCGSLWATMHIDIIQYNIY